MEAKEERTVDEERGAPLSPNDRSVTGASTLKYIYVR